MKLGIRLIINLLIFLSVGILLLYCISGRRSHALHKSISFQNQHNNPKCDVHIHIGIVWIGYKSNLYIYTMLKSLYFYRNNPLHFHIIVDDISEKNLKNMFNRWAVPQVTVTYYNINTFSLYSTLTLDNLKLMFPGLIPAEATSKIIIINAYLTFIEDISKLWNIFDYFEDNQGLGLIEIHNNTHSEKTNLDLETEIIAERFNSDVVLLNLEVLTTAGWEELVIRAVSEIMSLSEYGKLSDQMIINAIAVQNDELLYILPCHEDTQISNKTYIYHSKHRAEIVTWKNPTNLMITNNKEDYFKNLQVIFQECRAGCYKTQLQECVVAHENTMIMATSNDTCGDFYKAYAYQWRTLLFFREFKYNSSEDDVTLVSHFTYDRLSVLESLVERWKGPMSLALYITDNELYKFINFVEKSRLLQKRFNIAYHAIFKEPYHHPINLCRNVALRNVVTPYVFLNDIDFIPMQGMYDSLKKYVKSIEGMETKVLVVPAFDANVRGIPKTKNEMVKGMNRNYIHQSMKRSFPGGHGPTNHIKWKTAKEPYKIEWKFKYEPYIVAQSNITGYDERFVGYGWDKVSFITKLKAQGYEFFVLPNAFIVHKQHKAAPGKIQMLKSKRYKNCLSWLMTTVLKELKEKYKVAIET